MKIQRTFKVDIPHQPEKIMLMYSLYTSALIRAIKETYLFIQLPKKHSQKNPKTLTQQTFHHTW